MSNGHPKHDGKTEGTGFIPLCVPETGGNEWEYVKECLDTNWVSSVGPFVDRFEEMMAGYVGTKHAVATVSGTAALHIALLIAGVGPDDEVLVSSLTFIAPANAVRYVGAWPLFVDSEPKYWQMDPDKVVDFLENGCQWLNGALFNKKSGRQVKAILPVHILGHPCDLEPIVAAARKYQLTVIEDATESLGARYNGSMVGRLGDVSCFSFNGNKLITTGGGGMVVTDNEEWARRAKYLTTQAKDDPVEYVHSEIGYNYRLSNVQAAIGCAQFERLDSHITAKRRIAEKYGKGFSGLQGIKPMLEAPWASAVFWLYTVIVDEQSYGITSRALLKYLEASGIQARPLWQPLHRSDAHTGESVSDCAVAEKIATEALSIPTSVGLTLNDQDRVIEAVTIACKARPSA